MRRSHLGAIAALRRSATLALALLVPATASHAQDIIRSAAAWRSVRTQWFDVHYPVEAEAWALDLVPRLDAIRADVAALVGYAPPGRTTVLIDDPYNQPNGKAIPVFGTPVIHLWATPPGPTDQIANHRGWGLKLAAHEFGHIAHLYRPVRRSQWYWHIMPGQVSPIAMYTPRWAVEGYATWIEGKVTGSGRPHGAWRPALLRELALGGRLPSYGAMSAGGGYKGGSLAYLAGSAFWEWLGLQRGDSAITLVFRRQTARTSRTFDESFRGVYGDAPAVLYSRFAAELTAKSFAVDSALRTAGLVTGTRLARFSSNAGGPAVSRDGKRMALVLPGMSGARPRVVISAPDTQLVTDEERKQLQRQLERDPADVAAIRVYPRLAKPIATLTPRGGRFFTNPRFIDSSGTRVLLESVGVEPDGSQRPDLMIWNTVSGAMTRVTHHAATQDADPSPDGTRAAAVRCIGGVCDLVLVSLSNGAVTTLAHGSPTRVFSHPRWSPDGASLMTGVQERDGLWRLALVDLQNGTLRILTPEDDVNRHSASFDATGQQLVYVSEAGGIPNVESLRISSGDIRQRTRVVGSVYEPTPMPNGGILFLSEYAGGLDLQLLDSSTVVTGSVIGTSAAGLIPAMPRPREAGHLLDSARIDTPTAYGVGPRIHRLAAQTAMGRDGLMHSGVITSADPANRLTWTVAGMGGSAAAWRGGVASLAWYGSRPNIRAETFWIEQRATRQWNTTAVDAIDLRIAGASVGAELPISGVPFAQRLSLSGFVGAVQQRGFERRMRSVASLHYNSARVVGWRRSAGVGARISAGRTGDSSFARGTATAFVSAFSTRLDLRAHRATDGTPRLEQFSAGGFSPPLNDDATLGQRIVLPSLPVGIARGRSMYELRASRPMFFLPGTVYAHSVGTDWRPDRHSAVIGLEQAFDLDYLGIVGLPNIRLLGGVAHILRGPLKNKPSAYLTFRWRP
jgi:Tol biopolymer transport system component